MVLQSNWVWLMNQESTLRSFCQCFELELHTRVLNCSMPIYHDRFTPACQLLSHMMSFHMLFQMVQPSIQRVSRRPPLTGRYGSHNP